MVKETYEEGGFRKIVSQFKFSENYYENYEYMNDFEMEIMLMILEEPNQERLLKIYNKGPKDWYNYIFGICRSQLHQKNRLYYKKYERWLKNRETFIEESDED